VSRERQLGLWGYLSGLPSLMGILLASSQWAEADDWMIQESLERCPYPTASHEQPHMLFANTYPIPREWGVPRLSGGLSLAEADRRDNCRNNKRP
jgi:hypothetical protein